MVDPDKPNICKIGSTNNLERRLKEYRTASPQAFFSKTYKIHNRSHEKKIIEILKDIVPVDRECVRTGSEMVERVIDGYMGDHDVTV